MKIHESAAAATSCSTVYTCSSESKRDYTFYENRYNEQYNRTCIDGSITSCGNCVGYCKYAGHEGFLTKKQRQEHNCLGKGCFYYLPKIKKPHNKPKIADSRQSILQLISNALSDLEGLRVIDTSKDSHGVWRMRYVTITNEYSIPDIEHRLSALLDATVSLLKLDCDFEKAVKLIFAS